MNLGSPIKRRLTRQIHVGSVPVGGDAPIAVQSMTNTETTDVDATVAQIEKLEAAGADIVRSPRRASKRRRPSDTFASEAARPPGCGYPLRLSHRLTGD